MKQNIVFEELIKKLIKQEDLLADFYTLCLKKTLRYTKLWKFLINQEKGHSKVLENLVPSFESGEVVINSDLINLKLLDYSINFIGLKTNEIEYKKYSTLQLLELALQFELCTLESVIFESIESENQEVIDKMKLIQKQTEMHSQLLQKAIKQQKNIFLNIIGLFTGIALPTSE
jgi:hypothetical protein